MWDKILAKITGADKIPLGLVQGGQNAGHCYICNQHKETLTLHLPNTWLQELKCPFCVAFHFCSARVLSTAMLETYFYYHKDLFIYLVFYVAFNNLQVMS